MIFYASGTFTSPLIQQTVVNFKIGLLTSFAYKAGFDKQMRGLARKLRASNTRLPFMFDSGAFSAWTRGKEVDRDALVAACNAAQQEYADCFDFVFAALDRVPGRKGTPPTRDQIAEAAKESWSNFEHMTRHVQGTVIPCLHRGDPKWLEQRYAQSSPYVGLAASQDLPYDQRETWVALMSKKFANHRLHGFAMTGSDMLRTARWHSVDSATWVKWANFGCIAWLRANGTLMTLPVSRQSPKYQDYGLHLTTLTAYARDEVIETVGAMGITEAMLNDDADARASVSIVMFNRACEWATLEGTLPAQPLLLR
jgi:hypothetical protein